MPVVTWQVLVGTDDGSVLGTNFFPSNSGIRVGEGSGSAEISSYGRMLTDQIQQGATINSAELILIGEDDNNGPNATYDIAFELAVNPAAPTSQADFVSRVRTTVSTQVLNATTASGIEYRYDVTDAFQEIVDQPGFSEDDYIQAFLDADIDLTGNNDFCRYHSVESIPASAMSLEVDFTNPTGGGTVALSGTAIGGASIGATLSRVRQLIGLAQAAASLAGQLRRIRRLSADLNGSAQANAELRRRRQLSGDVSGSAAVSAELTLRKQLSASVQAGALSEGQLSRIRQLSAAINAAASLAGDLGRIRQLSGDVSGAASVGATLGVTGSVNLSGTAFGGASVDGQLQRIRTLSGSVFGGATVAGTLALDGIVELSAAISAGSEAEGILTLRKALSGSGTGGAVLSGDLSARKALSAAVTAGASVAANLSKMINYLPTVRIKAEGQVSWPFDAVGKSSYRLIAKGSERNLIN